VLVSVLRNFQAYVSEQRAVLDTYGKAKKIGDFNARSTVFWTANTAKEAAFLDGLRISLFERHREPDRSRATRPDS
jgi:hypothetical protein